MPHDFTYICNIKNRINKQTFKTDSQTQRASRWLIAEKEVGGLGKRDEGTKKYGLVVTES